MSASVGSAPGPQIGRAFVGPGFDALVIGGGLSLVVTALLFVSPELRGIARWEHVAVLLLLTNSAHFASSTVRLYAMPGAMKTLPVVTLVFPVVALGVLTLCIAFPRALGTQLQSLYLTWSPYHYAAQAYGLAVMYCMRSGCALDDLDKRLLRWTCMLPFAFAFVSGPGAGLGFGVGVGIGWLLPDAVLGLPWVATLVVALKLLLGALCFGAPLLLFARLWRSGRGAMPWISLITVLANAVWWIALPWIEAFVWATIFHGLQYLAIAVIFHQRDQLARPDNRHGALWHAAWFYTTSLALAYGLFYCLPRGYALFGFGFAESLLLAFAAINVHHFVVDGFIWRLARGSNRRIVEAGAR